jgi:O-antigen/teichoic acid export membrane protein
LVSLKKNVIANYVGQFYLTIIGIVMVPIYVRYMGAEAYGLVGFFALIQAWFQLLDIGLTPTMVRETARYQGGATDALGLRRLLRALEGFFVGVAVLGGLAMLAGSDLIATRWLKAQQLPLAEVRQAVMLMAVIVSLRWVCGLYRGAINGFERLVWLNGFNVLVATARFILVIPVFLFIGARPVHFFGFQLLIALVEVVVLVVQTYRLLPPVPAGEPIPWAWEPLRANLTFSLSIAFTGSVWVLVTQTDKLILSKLLTLTEYAYFSLAVLVASGVMVVIGPVSSALLPRLTRLAAEGDDAGLIKLYRNATQAVAIIAIPAALVLAFFAEQVVWGWTGNAAIAHKAAPVLRLYGLGNAFLALAAFPYYLQFAKGDLKLHLIGNIIFVTVLIPCLILATSRFGATGAGWIWLGSNACFFLFWTPIVHRRFFKDLHTPWLLRDILPIVVGPVLLAVVLQGRLAWPGSRAGTFGLAMAIGMGLLAVAGAGSSAVRNRVRIRMGGGKP